MAKVDKPNQTKINRAKWAALKAHGQKTKTKRNRSRLCFLVAIGGLGWSLVGFALAVPYGWLYICLILVVCCLLLQDEG